MKPFDFNNKTFCLVDNSSEGKVNTDTLFQYSQQDQLVEATYKGGPIVKGNIMTTLETDTLSMLYHCLTIENELKAGQAEAKVILNKDEKIELHLDWKWIGSHKGAGTSIYVEV